MLRSVGVCALVALASASGCTDEFVRFDEAPSTPNDPALVDPRGDASVEGGANDGAGGSGGTDAGSDADADTSQRGPPELAFEELTMDPARYPQRVVNFDFIPGTDEMLVLQQRGRMRRYRLQGDTLTLLETVPVPMHYGGECGLVTLAFDPDFATNRLLYYGYCISNQTWRIDRITYEAGNLQAAVDAAVNILELGANVPTNPWHNVGSLGFDPSGALWILSGDKTRDDAAQNPQSLLGKLLRIIPDRTAAGGYVPAPDNPGAENPEWAPEVYALGLRNMFRGVLDSKGRYFVADVGAATVEEINAITEPGGNFGWPRAEGPCLMDCDGLIEPLTHWNRNGNHRYIREDPHALNTIGRAAYVGYFYEPSEPDPYAGRLDHHLIFGDYMLGFVRALVVDDDTQVTDDIPLGHLSYATTWRKGPDGYLYTCQRLESQERGSPFRRAVLVNP